MTTTEEFVSNDLFVKQGNVPSELPPWMKFLHGKLANPSTPLNIRLFISKLIINTEEVDVPQLILSNIEMS